MKVLRPRYRPERWPGQTCWIPGLERDLVTDLGPAILGTCRYLDVTARHAGQNILLRERRQLVSIRYRSRPFARDLWKPLHGFGP